MSYLQCTECQHIADESEIFMESEWNPDISRYENFLVCKCGSRDGGFETAYPCETCEELAPLVDGTDLCDSCNQKATNLDRDLVALENEHHERVNGI